jgi:beta-glucosidase
MDRVVEPGEFKIMVGGSSPSYKAADRIKDSVGFTKDSEGVNTTVDYPHSFAANFIISYNGMEENLLNNRKKISIKVKNNGTLTDTGKAWMYVDGVQTEEVHHYELDPGQEKTIVFILDKNDFKNVTFATKYKTITQNF